MLHASEFQEVHSSKRCIVVYVTLCERGTWFPLNSVEEFLDNFFPEVKIEEFTQLLCRVSNEGFVPGDVDTL